MASSSNEQGGNRMVLKIITRQGVLFNGEVASVSSYNEKGPFDVLRRHTRFISIVKNKIIIRLLDGTVKEVSVDNAIMRVKNQEVQVFLGVKQK